MQWQQKTPRGPGLYLYKSAPHEESDSLYGLTVVLLQPGIPNGELEGMIFRHKHLAKEMEGWWLGPFKMPPMQ